MGRKSKHFTKADEIFIHNNCEELTVKEIARKRRISYSHVHNYMTRKGLPMIMERAKKKGCKNKKKRGGKFFNPDKDNGWII
jgi:hypothetical protein